MELARRPAAPPQEERASLLANPPLDWYRATPIERWLDKLRHERIAQLEHEIEVRKETHDEENR